MKWKKWCVGLAAAALLCGITIPAAADIAAEQNTEMDLPADEALEEKDEADKLSEGDFSTTIAYFVAVSPETPGTMYYKGQTEILTATVTSSENPDQPISDVSVTWVSSNTSVATVNENGEVTAVNDGTSEISVSAITVDGTTYQVSESAEEESTEDEDADTVTVETSGCCEVIVNLYTGFYETTENNKTVYYYYSNGVLMTNTVQNGKAFEGKTAWWYVDENGKASNTYTGFATNQNGVWYLESGKVTFCKNSVIQDKTGAIGTKGTWWYVVGSKVQTGFTGLADYANENGWWYIENGKVTFTKNTVAKNKNGWWYVTGSKVQFGFSGLANYANENGWWYIKNGKVDFTKNTVAKNKNGWWYVTGGKVQFGYTGLANYANENGWWYIKNGKVDFSYTGIGTNKNGQWYLANGKVNFNYSGYRTENGKTYILKNGKVISSGSYIWPLPGNTTITSAYGYHICPYHGYEFHGGIDIAAAKGTGILACAGGTVTAAGTSSSKGKYIEIDHGNGAKTTYWHCNSVSVKKGQKVTAGQVIGTVGMTGNATGYHLDLRFLVNGTYASPLSFVTPR